MNDVRVTPSAITLAEQIRADHTGRAFPRNGRQVTVCDLCDDYSPCDSFTRAEALLVRLREAEQELVEASTSISWAICNDAPFALNELRSLEARLEAALVAVRGDQKETSA